MQEYFITLHYEEYGKHGDVEEYHKPQLYMSGNVWVFTARLGNFTDEEIDTFKNAAEIDRPYLCYSIGKYSYPCAFTVHNVENEKPEHKAQRLRAMANFSSSDRSKIGKLVYDTYYHYLYDYNDDPISEMKHFLEIAAAVIKERPMEPPIATSQGNDTKTTPEDEQLGNYTTIDARSTTRKNTKRLKENKVVATIPSPDETTGQWIKVSKASEIFNVKIKNLSTYRSNGIKTPDGLNGIDEYGHRWRQRKPPNGPTEYFILNEDIDASDRG